MAEFSQESIDAMLSGEMDGEPMADQVATGESKDPQGVGTQEVASAARHAASVIIHAPDKSNTARPPKANIERILSINVPVAVMLAQQDLPIKSILDVTVGTIVEFDVPFDSNLTLEVANQPIAEEQAVKVGENFGLRIAQIGSVKDRIDALGGL